MMTNQVSNNDMDPVDLTSAAASSTKDISTAFPIARVKKIIKADKDVSLCSAEAVYLAAAATELFVETLVKSAGDIANSDKRRTILYKDFASSVKRDPRLRFLQELIPETVPYQVALEAQKRLNVTSNSHVSAATSNNSSPEKGAPHMPKMGFFQMGADEVSQSHHEPDIFVDETQMAGGEQVHQKSSQFGMQNILNF